MILKYWSRIDKIPTITLVITSNSNNYRHWQTNSMCLSTVRMYSASRMYSLSKNVLSFNRIFNSLRSKYFTKFNPLSIMIRYVIILVLCFGIWNILICTYSRWDKLRYSHSKSLQSWINFHIAWCLYKCSKENFISLFRGTSASLMQ